MVAVTLYTKPTCPYCIGAKQLLDSKGISYTDINITSISDEERNALSQKTDGYRTVPQIFIGETFVGGFDQLNQLNRQGKLDDMLSA
ncbi:MAG: glutaredoxin 3 [Moraxella sp.]|nr:glutaredoxin 3 [Moraxella sp.]